MDSEGKCFESDRGRWAVGWIHHDSFGGFHSHGGTPKSSISIGIVPYKPTILGYPHFRKPHLFIDWISGPGEYGHAIYWYMLLIYVIIQYLFIYQYYSTPKNDVNIDKQIISLKHCTSKMWLVYLFGESLYNSIYSIRIFKRYHHVYVLRWKRLKTLDSVGSSSLQGALFEAASKPGWCTWLEVS